MGHGMEIVRNCQIIGVHLSQTAIMAETDWDVDTDLEKDTADDQEDVVKVIIHNDDVTPMDFVVVILQRIFHLSPLAAEHVMITAHFNGVALVATLPLSEAKRRVGKAHFAAQLEGYPLLFTIEPL